MASASSSLASSLFLAFAMMRTRIARRSKSKANKPGKNGLADGLRAGDGTLRAMVGCKTGDSLQDQSATRMLTIHELVAVFRAAGRT